MLLWSLCSLHHTLVPENLIFFFSGCEGEKGFCQEGMTMMWWLRDCLWPKGCWHITGNCLQPSSQILNSPRVPSPQICSDVLQGLVRACLLWTFGKAGFTARQSTQVFSYPGMSVKGEFSNAKKQAVVWGNIFSQCFQITCSVTGEQNIFNTVLEARYSVLQTLLLEKPVNCVASKTITEITCTVVSSLQL